MPGYTILMGCFESVFLDNYVESFCVGFNVMSRKNCPKKDIFFVIKNGLKGWYKVISN